jgi:small subunit ribosomal protein S27Ae
MPKKKGGNKEKKGKKVKKKTPNIKKSNFYKITDNGIERIGKDCPKCGAGVKMGAHKEKDKIRYTCGKCGLTIWE